MAAWKVEAWSTNVATADDPLPSVIGNRVSNESRTESRQIKRRSSCSVQYLNRNYPLLRRTAPRSAFRFQAGASIGLRYRGCNGKCHFRPLRSQFLWLKRVDLGLEFGFERERNLGLVRFRTRHGDLGFARLSRSG